MSANAFGGVAGATPYGAVAGAVAQIAGTPNTSATGDTSSGAKMFGGASAGVNFGAKTPPWVWIAAAVGVAAFLYLRRKG